MRQHEIVDILLKAGIPAAPINTIDRTAKDPHIADAREMFVEIEHPKAGKLRMTGNQLKFTNKKIDTFTPAPLLSQHTREIMKDLVGVDDKRIDELMEKGVF